MVRQRDDEVVLNASRGGPRPGGRTTDDRREPDNAGEECPTQLGDVSDRRADHDALKGSALLRSVTDRRRSKPKRLPKAGTWAMHPAFFIARSYHTMPRFRAGRASPKCVRHAQSASEVNACARSM